ncbi:hypothetical protein N0V95_005954 [Ascochyta clinopodiicola]|nr:hypothetical protein N0V95_005954 [Ascochyta clinopodiicola]
MDAQADSRRIDRVVLACIQCRSRHVKCDSNQPICNRCRRDGKECIYQKSRRGGLDKAALARRRLKLQQEAKLAKRGDEVSTSTDDSSTPASSLHSDDPVQGVYPSMPAIDSLHVQEPTFSASATLSFQISDDRLLELYYEYFWPAFPIVLPLPFFLARRLLADHGLGDLSLVLEWIGSLYASWCPSEPYYQAALEAMSSPSLPRTAFTVQALMLFAVAQHHQDLRPESRRTLDLAILVALELDMNRRDFARVYGEGDPVLEESWRRTWYMLSIVDQHFAIVMNSPIYQLANMPNDVELPCDDEFFEAGVIMNTFASTGQFSSELVDACDTKIAVWQSLLPAVKKDPMRKNGEVDEVMFMAHMIAAITAELSVTAFLVSAPNLIPPTSGRSTHTARALKAVELQTKLLAIPCIIEKHNVFSMCICAQIGTAQISACTNLLEDHALLIARDRVKLSIGFLNAMGSIWSLGKAMAKDVRAVARSTLSAAPSTLAVQTDAAVEIELPRDELIWPIDPSAAIDIYSGIVLPVDWETVSSGTGGYASSTSSGLPELIYGKEFQML